jgi:hypothetical protein
MYVSHFATALPSWSTWLFIDRSPTTNDHRMLCEVSYISCCIGLCDRVCRTPTYSLAALCYLIIIFAGRTTVKTSCRLDFEQKD